MFPHARLASALPDQPLYYPYVPPTSTPPPLETPLDLAAFSARSLADPKTNGFRHWTVADYTSRFASRELSPVQVARAVLAAVDASEQEPTPLRLFVAIHRDQVIADARASAARWARGEPLGPLDGVPIAVKDEMAIAGFKTFVGTSFIGDEEGVAATDDAPIARVRAAGAVIVGKTNMHEIGSGVTGFNQHYGTVRNPHDPTRHTGGSSSGSAAAVAAGIVPLAIGVDGGGSIRIPSSLCGVVGIKPTFGRVPPLSPDCPSVGHIGPIATSVRDAALGFAVLSGASDDGDVNFQQPAVDLRSFDASADLKGVKVGYFPEFANHSAPDVAAATARALEKLRQRGAELVETRLGHLTAIHMAHSLTISSEFAQNLDKYFSRFGELSPEVQVVLSFGRSFSAMDFLAAQRVRAFALRQFREQVLSKADVFVTPSTAITAPEIPPETLPNGIVNAQLMDDIMRFSWYGNMIGVPGVSVPAGINAQGLPLAVQVQAAHWDEDLMLRVAHAVEQQHAAEQKKPQVYFDILANAKKQSAE